MADTLPTVWEADSHTRAKHAILRKYLEAWFPILSRQASAIARNRGQASGREILFVDGFAGPGEYCGGLPGSPVIALEVAQNHAASFPVPVRMLFIEERPDRFANLQRILQTRFSRLSPSGNIHAIEPRPGDCDTVLGAELDRCERNKVSFGPALAFLDQFGYGAVSMTLISRILRFGQCEVFTYLDYKDMNRFITDRTKAPTFTRAFGGEEWREAIGLPERERRAFLLKAYTAALADKTRGNATYVKSFSMFDRNGQFLYWLFFCTTVFAASKK
jgi:three-Cys-motif partner protein